MTTSDETTDLLKRIDRTLDTVCFQLAVMIFLLAVTATLIFANNL